MSLGASAEAAADAALAMNYEGVPAPQHDIRLAMNYEGTPGMQQD